MTTAQGRAAIRNHNAKLAAYQQLLEKVAPKPQQAAPQTAPAEAEEKKVENKSENALSGKKKSLSLSPTRYDKTTVVVAPNRVTQMTSENRGELQAKASEFKRKAREIAKALGIKITNISTNTGGYQMQEGEHAGENLTELSYTFSLDTHDKELIELFACLVGDLGNEVQESVIAGKYLSGKGKENNDTVARELRIPITKNADVDAVAKILHENGFNDFTIDESGHCIKILQFPENVRYKNKENGNVTSEIEEEQIDQYDEEYFISEEQENQLEEQLNTITNLIGENYDGTRIPRYHLADTSLLACEDRQSIYETWLADSRVRGNTGRWGGIRTYVEQATQALNAYQEEVKLSEERKIPDEQSEQETPTNELNSSPSAETKLSDGIGVQTTEQTQPTTAFEKKGSSAIDNTTDTAETDNGKRNDTATPQSTTSADKGTKNNSDGKTESGKSRRGQTAISSKKSIRKAIDKLFDGEVAGVFHQLAHIIREWLYKLGERHNFARGYGWIRDCSLLKLGTQDLVDLLRQSAQHLHNEGANADRIRAAELSERTRFRKSEKNSTFAETKRTKRVPSLSGLDKVVFEQQARFGYGDINAHIGEQFIAYTDNDFVVYTAQEDGDYRVDISLPIEGNKESIEAITNIFENGTDRERERLGYYVKKLRDGQPLKGGNSLSVASKRGGDGISDVLDSELLSIAQRAISAQQRSSGRGSENIETLQSRQSSIESDRISNTDTRFRKGRYGKNSSERLPGEWNAEKQAMLDEFGLNEVRLPAEEFGRFATAIERWADSNPTRFGETEIMSIPVYNDETEQWDLCDFLYQSSHKYVITGVNYDYKNQNIEEENGAEIYSEPDWDVQESDERYSMADFDIDGEYGSRQRGSKESSGLAVPVRGEEQTNSDIQSDAASGIEDSLSEKETPDAAVRFRTAARNGELTPLWSQVFFVSFAGDERPVLLFARDYQTGRAGTWAEIWHNTN